MILRSNYDTWELVERRVISSGSNNKCSKYCAPHLYNTSLKTLRDLKDIESSKQILKTNVFSETCVFESNLPS